jgi:flagellar biosynthesis protein FliQ
MPTAVFVHHAREALVLGIAVSLPALALLGPWMGGAIAAFARNMFTATG